MEKYKQYINNPEYEFITYSKNYNEGGIHIGVPNASIEKQENVMFPNGKSYQSNSGTHESGDDDNVNLPTQSLIFSDRLKMPGTGKTFADLNKKNNTDKQMKVLEDDNSSSTAKATAQLIKDVKNKKSLDIFNAQELLKKTKLANYANKLGVQLPQQEGQEQFGGGGIKKYWRGGTNNGFTDGQFDDTYYPKEEYGTLSTQQGINENGQPFAYNKYDFDSENLPDNTPLNPTYPTSDATPKYNVDILVRNPNYYNPETQPTNSNISRPEVKPPGKPQPNFWDKNGQSLQDASAGLAQTAPYLWSLHNNRFGKKYDTTTPYLTTPHLLSDREAIKDNLSAYKTNMYNAKQLGGPGVLSAYNNAYASKVMNDAKIRESFANQNAGILNQVDQFNVGQRLAAQELNMRSKARSEDQARLDMQGIGNVAANVNKDYNTNVQQENMIKYISNMYPDYIFDRNKGWFYNTKGEELILNN